MRTYDDSILGTLEKAPYGQPYVRVAVEEMTLTRRQQSSMGCNTAVALTRYLPVFNGDVGATATTWLRQKMPCAGTFRNLRVINYGAVPQSTWITYTFRVNAVNSSLAVTLPEGSNSVGYSDLANTATVAAGDYIDFIQTVVGGGEWSGEVLYTCVFEPAVEGEIVLVGGGQCLSKNDGYGERPWIRPFQGVTQTGATATEAEADIPFAAAGTIRDFYVEFDTSVGTGGDAWTLTLYKNGSPTTLTVTVTEPALTGSDTAHDVTVAAGDLLAVNDAETGTPLTSTVRWGFVFVPDATGESVIVGLPWYNLLASVGNIQLSARGTAQWTAGTPLHPALSECTLKTLYVNVNVAPGAGKSHNFKVYKNNVATDLAVTISDAATSGNNTSDEVSISDLDYVHMVHTPSGTPATANAEWSLVSLSPTSVPVPVYTTHDRILAVTQFESAWVDGAEIILDNHDKYFSDKDLEGTKLTLGFGFMAVYDNVPDLYVEHQEDISIEGRLMTRLICIGNWGRLKKHKIMGNTPAAAYDTDTTTVKGIINAALAKISMGTVTVDSSDGAEDTVVPEFVYEVDRSLRYVIATANNLTTNLLKMRGTGLRMIQRDDTASSDYDYNLLEGHTLFSLRYTQSMLEANRIIAFDSMPDTDGTTGSYPSTSAYYANDTDDQALFGITTLPVLRSYVTSDAESKAAADALLSQIQRNAVSGVIVAPMNCGQEMHDLIAITDQREGWTDKKVRVGGITRRFRPGVFEIEITFGGLLWDMPEPIDIPSLIDVGQTIVQLVSDWPSQPGITTAGRRALRKLSDWNFWDEKLTSIAYSEKMAGMPRSLSELGLEGVLPEGTMGEPGERITFDSTPGGPSAISPSLLRTILSNREMRERYLKLYPEAAEYTGTAQGLEPGTGAMAWPPSQWGPTLLHDITQPDPQADWEIRRLDKDSESEEDDFDPTGGGEWLW